MTDSTEILMLKLARNWDFKVSTKKEIYIIEFFGNDVPNDATTFGTTREGLLDFYDKLKIQENKNNSVYCSSLNYRNGLWFENFELQKEIHNTKNGYIF